MNAAEFFQFLEEFHAMFGKIIKKKREPIVGSMFFI